MVDISASLTKLRMTMEAFPSLESHSPLAQINLSEIYFPKSHAAALDPDRALIVGNRGMGKSFWASALVSAESRERISKALPEARVSSSGTDVRFGFADAEGVVQVSRDELALLIKQGANIEQIWRAVTLPALAERANQIVPRKLNERLSWVASEPGDVRELMRRADALLTSSKTKLVFIFDQLEQLADDLETRSNLTRGIIRLALAFKSYRSLRVKIFMRPDHYSEDNLFSFPDASKVRGEAVQLDWRPYDLYGLLYSRLLRANAQEFGTLSERAGVLISKQMSLPQELADNEERQHAVFDVIAGDAMGARKRGLPYTWLVSHLADARNQVSPRTFLRALKYAAENRPAPTTKVIDQLGIHEGVRKASENRVDDLKEDYPWIPPALDALRGLLVPCLPSEMVDKWLQSPELLNRLLSIPNAKQPAWMIEQENGVGFSISYSVLWLM